MTQRRKPRLVLVWLSESLCAFGSVQAGKLLGVGGNQAVSQFKNAFGLTDYWRFGCAANRVSKGID